MGNIHSFDRGDLSPAERDRLLRRTKKFGHGRAEIARSDLRAIPQLSQNPFLDAIFRLYDTGKRHQSVDNLSLTRGTNVRCY